MEVNLSKKSESTHENYQHRIYRLFNCITKFSIIRDRITSTKKMDHKYFIFGQINQFLKDTKSIDEKNIEKLKIFLDKDFDINYKIPANSLICQKNPQYSGNTIMHFLVEFYFDKSVFHLFLKYGADLTIQNSNGCTPLLLAFIRGNKHAVDLLLESHIERQDFKNYTCENGISHFHVVCTVNNENIVRPFLVASSYINMQINNSSPYYPGYTPLHLAMENGVPNIIELLLYDNPNLHSKEANGLTPLHLLIKKLTNISRKIDIPLQTFFDKLLNTNPFDLPDEVNLSSLHVSCLLDDFDIKPLLEKNKDIDLPIQFDSPFCPGFRPLHFAAHFKTKSVLILLKEGADIFAKDASGTTPFDICLRNFELDMLISILSIEKKYNISKLKLTDDTYLLSLLRAMKNIGDFKKFLQYSINNVNTFIPLESPLWPGFNLLHLALTLSVDIEYFEFLIPVVDFSKKNAYGMSPLHLAHHMYNDRVVKRILHVHDKIPLNQIDQNKLSHLHIACLWKDFHKTVELLLRNGADPNAPALHQDSFFYFPICSGSTSLHIVAEKKDYDLIKLLLSFGGNPNLLNANGVTPFQIFLNGGIQKSLKFQDTLEMMFNAGGKELLSGSKAIDTFQMVLNSNCKFIIWRWLREVKSLKLYEKLGLTRLQLACALGDLTAAREELESGADVNEQIPFKSLIWPGDTALHISFRRTSIILHNMPKLLFQYGADPTIKNLDGSTPIHISRDTTLSDATMLLKNKFTHVNPMNNDGLSHFHLCCMTDNLQVIQEFLKTGININTPTDHFADLDAGYTPLHFAVKYGSDKVSDLLNKHGANMEIKNAAGQTPLDLSLRVVDLVSPPVKRCRVNSPDN